MGSKSSVSSDKRITLGIWIELGVFLLVFVFAAWQFHDLRREKEKRLARERESLAAKKESPPS